MAAVEDGGLDDVFAMVAARYGVRVNSFEELKLGADRDSHAWKIDDGKTKYFLKIRTGRFNELSVVIPDLLAEKKGIENIVKPVKTLDGKLFAGHSSFYVCLYPFVEGKNCWNYEFSEEQWNLFGKTVYALHGTDLPDSILNRLSRENYGARSRKRVYDIINNIGEKSGTAVKEYADFLAKRKETIKKIIDRAESGAGEIKLSPPENCLCHGDLHAGNIMATEDGALFIVDWDTVIYAPKERDLMFIGGGIGKKWNTPDEIKSFYSGYKNDAVSGKLLSYYRHERIVEDIEEFDSQITDPSTGIDEKMNIVNLLESQFDKNDVVDMAFRTDAWGEKFQA